MPVPFKWPKASGFNCLPEGTVKQHDAGKWALYYNPAVNFSFIVTDYGDFWKIDHYLGRLKVGYAKTRMRFHPCVTGECE